MKGNQLMRKPKLLRALLILLFVAAPIQWTRAQIVLSTPKTTLGAVIKNIKSQSNYQFFYDDKLAEMPVNAIDVKNGSLQSVLDAALQGKGITYKPEFWISNFPSIEDNSRKTLLWRTSRSPLPYVYV